MRDGFESMSRRRGSVEARARHSRGGARYSWHQLEYPHQEQQRGRWANLPPELLLDVIQRVEQCEVSWPARRHLVACAAVCRTWRAITKEVVKTPEQCGRITFPISLKQVAFAISFPYQFKLNCLLDEFMMAKKNLVCFHFIRNWILMLVVCLKYSRGRAIIQFSASLEGNGQRQLIACILD